MFTRTLGRSGVEISAMGLGCWAIGGPFWRGETPVGWGEVNDEDSIRAIRRGLELGVTFFDTADVYGVGHSEEVLARALEGRRDGVVIATKFGNVFDVNSRKVIGADGSAAYVRAACDASLRRLKTDRIDLYQFHVGDYDPAKAAETRDTLEQLVAEGKIRWYGWSTDDPARAQVFAEGPHCTAVQQHLNLFGGNFDTLALCEALNLASVNRGPLGMGVLTGKFTKQSSVPADDVRSGWDFSGGHIADQLEKVDALREVLTAGGRTLAQGALGWLWARSGQTIPIPGFKTVQQVEENAAALEHGPLSDEQMRRIERLLGREPATR